MKQRIKIGSNVYTVTEEGHSLNGHILLKLHHIYSDLTEIYVPTSWWRNKKTSIRLELNKVYVEKIL